MSPINLTRAGKKSQHKTKTLKINRALGNSYLSQHKCMIIYNNLG